LRRKRKLYRRYKTPLRFSIIWFGNRKRRKVIKKLRRFRYRRPSRLKGKGPLFIIKKKMVRSLVLLSTKRRSWFSRKAKGRFKLRRYKKRRFRSIFPAVTRYERVLVRTKHGLRYMMRLKRKPRKKKPKRNRVKVLRKRNTLIKRALRAGLRKRRLLRRKKKGLLRRKRWLLKKKRKKRKRRVRARRRYRKIQARFRQPFLFLARGRIPFRFKFEKDKFLVNNSSFVK